MVGACLLLGKEPLSYYGRRMPPIMVGGWFLYWEEDSSSYGRSSRTSFPRWRFADLGQMDGTFLDKARTAL